MMLIGVAYLLNILRILISHHFSVSDVCEYFTGTVFTMKNLVLWLFFNVTTVSGVAWFLFALLYTYLIALCFFRFFHRDEVFVFAVIGFLGGIIVKIVFPLVGINGLGTNSVWFCGGPFFICGKYIRSNQEKIVAGSVTCKCFVAATIGC